MDQFDQDFASPQLGVNLVLSAVGQMQAINNSWLTANQISENWQNSIPTQFPWHN